MPLENAEPLDPSRGVKPLDFGWDGVTGSVDADGRMIAVNVPHPQHGYATLSAAVPFTEGQRYNAAAVRAYRAGLAALAGFGPQFERAPAQRAAFLLDDAIPHVRLAFADGNTAHSTTFAHAGGALQIWQIDGAAPQWRGDLSLQRCAYTQLTEGGPLPMPDALNHLRVIDGVLVFENPALPLAAAVTGLPFGAMPEIQSHTLIPVKVDGQSGMTVLAFGFGPDAHTAREHALALLQADVHAALDEQRCAWRALLDNLPDRLVRRGLVYGRELAVPVGESACILTDHMLLPLSWNRDAYYVARAFLIAPAARRDAALHDIVRRHLLWMFETAERPGGIWGRCYTANGTVKDCAYQLDQQLFPLLELADYVETTGDRATLDRLTPHLRPLLDLLLAYKMPDSWLFPTDETPADDPVTLPYHLSSHILLWYTLRRMHTVGLGDLLAGFEGLTQDAINAQFIAPHHGQRLYAYAVDAQGAYRFYHDANDIPFVLAPAWGFVPADDVVWRATVDFAFSQANRDGYYTSGLGSVHTPAPWPLGGVQDLIVARATGDSARAAVALDRLRQQAQWDGALPEAYHPETHAVVSRHWFAWPNAALACALLGAFDDTAP